MEIINFTPMNALVGGTLIGLSGALLMWLNGRIAGISGMLSGLLSPGSGDGAWRFAFLAGLLLGGLAFRYGGGDISAITIEANTARLIGAGLLVGFGARLASGCTSGHGVCGVSRASPRGIVSTLIYVGVAVLTVYITHHVIGG